jgi:hypothetical protein
MMGGSDSAGCITRARVLFIDPRFIGCLELPAAMNPKFYRLCFIFEPNPFIQRAVRMLAYRTCAALAPHDMLTHSKPSLSFSRISWQPRTARVAVVHMPSRPTPYVGIAALAASRWNHRGPRRRCHRDTAEGNR